MGEIEVEEAGGCLLVPKPAKLPGSGWNLWFFALHCKSTVATHRPRLVLDKCCTVFRIIPKAVTLKAEIMENKILVLGTRFSVL